MIVAATERDSRGLVANVDESCGGIDVDANGFPGAIHPRGFEHIVSFTREVFPVWEYEANGVRLRKTVAAPRGENTTIVLYEVLAAPAPFELRLTPFFADRHYHSLLRRGPAPTGAYASIGVPAAH